MEQVRVQPQQDQPNSLRCPRCGSLDTRFRYFNNYSNKQPRYLCNACNRQWTVGGILRNIPFGGRTRPGKKTNATTSRSQLPQPPFSIREHLQNSPILRPSRATFPQYVDTTMIQQPANFSRVVSPLNLYYFNHDISFLDAVQSLQPQVMNHHVDYGDQTFSISANMEIPQDWNIQTVLSQQEQPQQVPMQSESYPTHDEGDKSSLGLNNNSLVHPTYLMNALPQDSTANFDISASNALWKNHNGKSSNIEPDTTPVDVDEWLNLSGYDSS